MVGWRWAAVILTAKAVRAFCYDHLYPIYIRTIRELRNLLTSRSDHRARDTSNYEFFLCQALFSIRELRNLLTSRSDHRARDTCSYEMF